MQPNKGCTKNPGIPKKCLNLRQKLGTRNFAKTCKTFAKLALSHSLTLDMLNNFCFHVYAQNLLSISLAISLSLSLAISLSHSFNLSFNHSRHVEQVLFSCLGSKVTVSSRKLQCFFLDFSLSTLPCEFRSHRAGSQLKTTKGTLTV